MADGSYPADALDPVIEEVRLRFIADFPMRCDTAVQLINQTLVPTCRVDAVPALRSLAHRLAGLAGLIGFRRVSAHASELEEVTLWGQSGELDAAAARAIVDALQTAFSHEVAGSAAPGGERRATRTLGTILLAEDDEDQRAVVTRHLEEAGYQVEGVSSGDLVIDRVRAVRPSVVLLDVEMPRLDGYSVCRQLKADATLSAIPVLFLTTRTRLDDRLVGLTLGADDYLAKPVDPGELLIRLERVRARFSARAEEAGATDVLSFEEFAQVSRSRLGRTTASLVLIRLSAAKLQMAASHVTSEIRRTDLAGYYDRCHLLLLMPGLTGPVASTRATEILAGLTTSGVDTVAAGIAWTPADGAKSLETLLAEADQALMQARHFGKPAVVYGEAIDRSGGATRGSVLVAEDDPDVVRILDAQMRGAGYDTSLAFDGAEALSVLDSRPPDVLILDLMMPKVGGFDLLSQLNAKPVRPKVLVLSARGREEDVTRAFELGADDYVTKPFNPQELLARVARLSR
jgi:DNA-binding response OmpR family regulator